MGGRKGWAVHVGGRKKNCNLRGGMEEELAGEREKGGKWTGFDKRGRKKINWEGEKIGRIKCQQGEKRNEEEKWC